MIIKNIFIVFILQNNYKNMQTRSKLILYLAQNYS